MYQAIILPHFLKQLKKSCKKYRGLKDELIFVLNRFRKESVVSLGKGLFKMRLRSSDVPKGKSRSFRLIVLLMEFEQILIPIAIYSKADCATLSWKEINRHLEKILTELHRQ